ncbi:MAG TPA: 50S ribosomal protein L18 [Candidatus Nanoarchaeia archaeon]|nr:50S ribosomal protein L18 [Candidatus Nanoarchaeia archaeon]
MTSHKVIGFRRKRKGKTDYKKRLKILLSRKPRLVVRRTLNNTIVQIAEYGEQGDRIVAAASTRDLVKTGWKYSTGNAVSAYIAGIRVGRKGIAGGIKEAVVDIGKQRPSLRIFSAVKGARDAGIDVACGESVLPKAEVVNGSLIKAYADFLKQKGVEKYKKQFSRYEKEGLKIEDMGKAIEAINEGQNAK